MVPAGAKIAGLDPGDVLFFGSGQNNNPVFRITGWGKFHRQTAPVAVSAEQAASIAAERQAELAGSVRIPHIGLGYMNGVKVDGKLDAREWKNTKVLEIKDGNTVRARAYLAWEAVYASMNARHGLCVAFDVNTDRPWKSASTPQRAFQDGAAVEIRLGPPGSERKAAGPGDVRIVAAPVGEGGKTVAVEFMPRLPPGWGRNARKPVTYETGKGKVTFERVSPLRNNWVAAGPKPDGSGYVVEMLIPLRPPLVIQPGLRFRIDASIVLADAEGTKSELRLPWHSTDEGDTGTTDTYSDSLLRPHNWAEAMIE